MVSYSVRYNSGGLFYSHSCFLVIVEMSYKYCTFLICFARIKNKIYIKFIVTGENYKYN